MADQKQDLISRLSLDIAKDVGNMAEDELSSISTQFNKILDKALKSFNSQSFNDDGFIKKLKDIDFGDKKNKDVVRNVLNTIKNEYVDVQTLNHSEILLRRDLFNICTQMPELRDVIYLIRDAIIESNVATGEVSRSISFENHQETEVLESQCKDVERKYNLLMAIKNFIIPRTLMIGEMYIHVVPYAKMFAELEAIKNHRVDGKFSGFRESIPNTIIESFTESKTLYSDKNLNIMMESISPITKVDSSDTYRIQNAPKLENSLNGKEDLISKTHLKSLLENIEVNNGSSILMTEMGAEGFKEFISREYKEYSKVNKNHFHENMTRTSSDIFGKVPEDEINFTSYESITGCYVKYLDALRLVPIRIDRRIIGYYYVTTTMDLQINPAQPTGIVDLSFQHYTRDKNLVDKLTGLIIQSFDKKMLEKNIQFKNEIAEIVMGHRFSEGRLSFIFIPESEVVRIIINEDENGKGHSVIEPTLFPARMYLMLTLYNMLYILNNNMTRIHYLKSSGLNKDYAAQIQRVMRKFQSRRITIDDIYSYSGVLNKVGGMGEMVLPSGRGDYKAIETDTLEPAANPISIEFLEQQRRQAISGSGVPYLMSTNIIDEVDFAKTMEMANTRFISTTSSYKIDFNKGITEFYQKLMKYNTDIDDSVIKSFRFQFHTSKQQELNITTDMINSFNGLVELTASLYYSQDQLIDREQKPTPTMKHLKKELAKEYLPQLDFDNLDQIVSRVNVAAMDDILQDRVKAAQLTHSDIDTIVKNAKES